MDRKYWEQMAPGYDDEIFDVLKNDRRGLIMGALKTVAAEDKTVIDLGCAVGKWLPLLSPAFKKVVAVDISKRNLKIAASRHTGLKNVQYTQADLSASRTSLPRADVALCVNAVLSTSFMKRESFFKNISTTLRKGGSLLLVVPSLESWLLTRIVQSRYKIEQHLFRKPVENEAALRYHAMQQGNAEIDNVLTKHYLADELNIILREHGFDAGVSQKIEYEWTTEFNSFPKNIISNPPWDWFVEARKL